LDKYSFENVLCVFQKCSSIMWNISWMCTMFIAPLKIPLYRMWVICPQESYPRWQISKDLRIWTIGIQNIRLEHMEKFTAGTWTRELNLAENIESAEWTCFSVMLSLSNSIKLFKKLLSAIIPFAPFQETSGTRLRIHTHSVTCDIQQSQHCGWDLLVLSRVCCITKLSGKTGYKPVLVWYRLLWIPFRHQ
jgi:hypothetical protein